jgi:tRNA modification GTPase
LKKLTEVDLVFYIYDAHTGVTATDREFFARIPWEKTELLANKADLPHTEKAIVDCGASEKAGRYVSAATGAGVKELRAWLKLRLKEEVSEDSTVVSNARHFEGLQILARGLETCLPLMMAEESPDLIALELQSGLRAVHEILGLDFDDQVMDRVFAEFCLGK